MGQRFRKGDRVRNRALGRGTITGASQGMYTVQFDSPVNPCSKLRLIALNPPWVWHTVVSVAYDRVAQAL